MSDRYERDPEDFADWPEQDDPDPEDCFEHMPQENERYQIQPDQDNPWNDPEYIERLIAEEERQSSFAVDGTPADFVNWAKAFPEDEFGSIDCPEMVTTQRSNNLLFAYLPV